MAPQNKLACSGAKAPLPSGAIHNNNIKFIIRVKRNIATHGKYPFLRIIRRDYVKSKDQQVIIATNISKETKDNSILKLYSKRWNIVMDPPVP